MISEALRVLFPDININPDGSGDAVIEQDNQGNEYIAVWNRVEPEPTPAEIDAAYLIWLAGALDRAKVAAVIEVNKQASANYEVWQAAYASYGDWLAILQVVNTSLRSVRINAITAIRNSTTQEQIAAVVDELVWPEIPDQSTIEDDVSQSLEAIEEGKQFLQDNPVARNILTLPYEDMLAGIRAAFETPNVEHQILLAQFNALVARYVRALMR